MGWPPSIVKMFPKTRFNWITAWKKNQLKGWYLNIHLYLFGCIPFSRGVESFTITTINFSTHGSNKRFFDKLNEGSRAESNRYVLKLRNNYYIVLIWIDKRKYITSLYYKKFIRFFFIWITRMIFDWYWKRYGYWKRFWK